MPGRARRPPARRHRLAIHACFRHAAHGSGAHHRVIKDLALLAQEPYGGELNRILEQWDDWVGESKTLHLSERPPPYKAGKVKKGTAGHRT